MDEWPTRYILIRMSRRFLTLGVIAIVAVGGIAFVLYSRQPSTSQPGIQACTQEAKICPDGTAVGRTGPDCSFAPCSVPIIKWKFMNEGIDASNTPQTSVSVSMNGKVFPAGMYEGSCSEIASTSWALLPGEKAGATCWFAGGGTELGVFDDNGILILKKGVLDEGSVDTAPTRGNFQPVVTLTPSVP